MTDTLLSMYGFLAEGLQLLQMRLVPARAQARAGRHPAATLLPTWTNPPRVPVNNPQPVSLALSPYVALGFVPTPNRSAVRFLAMSELVGFNTARTMVVSLKTEIWYRTPALDSDELMRAWGEEMLARLAPDSPVGLVRLRELWKTATGVGVVVVYRNLRVRSVAQPPQISKRATSLRAPAALLRAAQGQYGGASVPERCEAFELAPPQVRGVQPIRISEKIGWPWGLSALRIGVRQLASDQGVAGPVIAFDDDRPVGRVWWRSLTQQVQYTIPGSSDSRKILPVMFRAPAMSSLLPAWPVTPLPDGNELRAALGPAIDTSTNMSIQWQPLLPGAYTTIISGARPGVPFLLREYLQTQDFGSSQVVASGAVPVMHRMPRPVLLPKNVEARPQHALQTWAHALAPESLVLVTGYPADSAFVDRPGGRLHLLLELTSDQPRSVRDGQLPSDWDLLLRFKATKVEGDTTLPKNWSPEADLFGPGLAKPMRFTLKEDSDTSLVFEPDGNANRQVLTEWLSIVPHSSLCQVRISLGRDGTDVSDIKGYRETLRFPVRVARDRGVMASPLRPEFLLFEDPEYNRRL